MFLLEVAAHGNAGDFAAVALTAVNDVPISPSLLSPIGVCNSGDIFACWTPVAPAFLPAGTTVALATGTLNPVSGILTMAPGKVLTFDL